MAQSTTQVLKSLNHNFSSSAIGMSLTEAGLLVDRSEAIVRLYVQYHSWTEVKERWHAERIHERGSRSSAQRIFRIIKRRLQAGGSALPSISTLHNLVQQCPTAQAKAQLFYFYLIQEDGLFRFVLHEVLRQQGIDRDRWDLSPATIESTVRAFHYENGSALKYADSTLSRWVQGFRSVLVDIGVLKRPYDKQGTVPTIDLPPLHVASLYSWNKEGKKWLEQPTGFFYLFQPRSYREALLGRIASSDQWARSKVRDQEMLVPAETEMTTK